jgi:hypothetical protein
MFCFNVPLINSLSAKKKEKKKKKRKNKKMRIQLNSEQKSTNNSTIDLPVELVGLLKHAGKDGKKITWDLQVNSSVYQSS